MLAKQKREDRHAHDVEDLDTDGCRQRRGQGRSLAKLFEKTIRKLNAEASYFVAQDGLRCALIFFDMKESSELPAIAEPLFAGVNAEIEVIPAMNADDLKKGLGAAMSAA
jgi:hypothetical protein